MATPYSAKTETILESGQPGIQYDFPGDPRDFVAHAPFMAAAGVSGAVRLPGIRRSVQIPADREQEAEAAMLRALGRYPPISTEPDGDKPQRRKKIYVGGNFIDVARL